MAFKMLRRMDTAGLPDDFALSNKRYGFGLSWDAPSDKPKVDLDLQAVVIDSAGAIIDCAYYNNLKAVRSITHSGDEISGEKSGIDEQVWVGLPKLPPQVSVIVFVVAAYAGGYLRDVCNGIFHVFDGTISTEIARFDLEQSTASVDVVAAMFKGEKGWTLRIIDEPAQQGQHFMDILDLIGQVTRTFIPTAPKKQKIAFAMEKGGILDLPQAMDSITVGLGWDAGEGEEVDLDVSAVLLDASGGEVETVFFGMLESTKHGIKHSGDNLDGEGDGDDEQITACLSRIGPNVQQVVFVVNIYTSGHTFQQVRNAYARVVDNASASEQCRYMLSDAGRENGLIVAKLQRGAADRWGFHALGLPCTGRTYKDSLRHIQQICQQDTRGFMKRGSTLESLEGVGLGSMGAPTGSMAGPPASSAGPYAAAPAPYAPGAAYPGGFAGAPHGSMGGYSGMAGAPPAAMYAGAPVGSAGFAAAAPGEMSATAWQPSAPSAPAWQPAMAQPPHAYTEDSRAGFMGAHAAEMAQPPSARSGGRRKTDKECSMQ